MKVLTLLVLSAAASALPAQTTWGNLHFGQTRDTVRSALTAQGFTVAVSNDGSLQSVNNYELPLPDLRRSLPLRADLHFTDAGNLMDVTLVLDLIEMRRTFPDFGGDEALLRFSSERLNRALSDKYGLPVFRSPECDSDQARRPYAMCAIDWRGPGQAIQLERPLHTSRLVLRYQELAPDL